MKIYSGDKSSKQLTKNTAVAATLFLLTGLFVACNRLDSTVTTEASDDSYDIVISNGRVVDGTGAPWFRSDVGIRGERIVRIGDLHEAKAKQRVDATNLVVSPGFIDMLGQSEFNVLVDNRAASKILQGVTTEITGEGGSIAPVNDRLVSELFAGPAAHYKVTVDWRSLSDYFTRLEQRTHPAINLGTFVGAGGMGALGLSSSLQYMPDRFATTDELVELAKVAAQFGGIYITHQRSESGKIFESLDEIFAIAERAKIPAEIFHLKTAYKANWGKMAEVLKRIHDARDRGLDITADQYPYIRASNGLDACLPLWMREGGKDKMIARLKDPLQRERAKKRWTIRRPKAGRISGMVRAAAMASCCLPCSTVISKNTRARRSRKSDD
ncbi:MAG: hypothetical protein IPG76_23860 [Acidobacteria bacterium]|nr:hypothetical protein [Acidobacteriota bacterium]